jgi:copper(I)-binding protein
MIVFAQRALLVLAGLLVLGLWSCSSEPAPDLSFSGAWVRVPPGGRDVTGGYVLVQNTGGADKVIAASSPVAEHIEIHEHVERDGMMQMREVPFVPVPAHGEVAFQPGGYHLMMFGVHDLSKGQQVKLTLVFERAGEQEISAIVGKVPVK